MSAEEKEAYVGYMIARNIELIKSSDDAMVHRRE